MTSNLGIEFLPTKLPLQYGNEFPMLDFKIKNPTIEKVLLKSIIIKTENVSIDTSPSLEYSLETDNGDLILKVTNFGYGDANDFSALIDFSHLKEAIHPDYLNIKLVSSNISENQTFLLIPKHATNIEKCEEQFRLSIEDKFAIRQRVTPKVIEHYKDEIKKSEKKKDSFLSKFFSFKKRPYQFSIENMIEHHVTRAIEHAVEKRGVKNVPSSISYVDLNGISYKDEINVCRISRGAYDWNNIIITENGFETLHYDEGTRYSLVHPSASYHFILNPQTPSSEIEHSVAHELAPNSFERINFIIGADISLNATLTICLKFDSMPDLISPKIHLNIWNPKNTFYSKNGGEKINSNSLTKIRGEDEKYIEPYDIETLKQKRERTWGY